MADNLKVGDSVMIKSGGPTMTVTNVDDYTDIICVWFDKSDKPHRMGFDQDILDHVI